ncbi:unnamed protein product [Diatraea saccharalis]|uniref:Uncharacterized protein n=1 Tax=Diatraea saccharalis TaxID=40085 RepID=A0A9N9WCL5_9NEOP|nr:unnamed protein product [Diatraea saccharalis]
MENDEDKQKKLNEDVVGFMRKRSETEPRYAARLLAYVDLHRKRSRAAAAKLRSETGYERKISANRKKAEIKQKEKNAENSHQRYDLLQLIMMGKVAGKRKVGGRKKSWLRNIREWTGIASAAELFRRAKDKKDLNMLIANLHELERHL